MNFLEEDSVLFARIQYNNFRKGHIFDYLHNKKLIKFKNEHYLFSESLKTQLDFDRIKKDFSQYTKFTIYVCNICATNVFMSNKYVLRCNHDICYNCYKRIKPNTMKQILCPYCRNVNEISEDHDPLRPRPPLRPPRPPGPRLPLRPRPPLPLAAPGLPDAIAAP